MSSQRPLKNLQCWMQEVITHPEGIAAGLSDEGAQEQIDVDEERLESVITRSKRLDSVGRLAVYGNAYFARLIECLGEEFSATRYALGEDGFNNFALGYIQAIPPTRYSLGFLGERFPAYLRATRPADISSPGWPDFLIDLATLERTYAEVFDGPGTENRATLSPEDLQSIPQERVGDLILEPAPCVRLLELRFPVHEYVTAVRRSASPEIPSPETTRLVIARREFVVRRGAVSIEEFQLIAELLDGRSLGEAIMTAAESVDQSIDEFAGQLANWFEHWTAAGWFVSARLRE